MWVMKVTVSFPNWSDVLEEADLPERERHRHRIVINWFLGYLKREQVGASVDSAREFVAKLVERRRPEDWQVEQWREGLNWFFAMHRRGGALGKNRANPAGKRLWGIELRLRVEPSQGRALRVWNWRMREILQWV